MLVVHGARGGFDQSVELAQPIAKRDFRVVAMSRFGYLRTVMPVDASPAAQADAHLGLMDALGIDRAVVLGASAGAPSAFEARSAPSSYPTRQPTLGCRGRQPRLTRSSQCMRGVAR